MFSICRRAREAFRRPALEDVPSHCGDDSTEDTVSGTASEEPCSIDRLCEALRRNDPNIKDVEIDCEERQIDDHDLLNIADSLRKNHVVSDLIFRNVELGENSRFYLMAALKESKSIKSLHFEDVRGFGQIVAAEALTLNPRSSVKFLHIEGSFIDSNIATALGRMLSENLSLEELRLCHCRVDPESVVFLAQGLRRNRALKILRLVGNRLDDAAVSKLSNALAYNQSLQLLALDFNHFCSYGVRALASMLKINQHLKELDLFGNRIDSLGAIALAEALRTNSTLNSLVLSFNQIGDDGIAALADSLTVNHSLKKLYFPSNVIGSNGLIAFGQFLPLMSGLEELHVGDYFNDDAAAAIIEGLASNTTLRVLLMESAIYSEGSIEERLEFYLRLNRSGRRLLHTHKAPETLWANAIERANKNRSERNCPDVLFYLLRSKPDLFEQLSLF